MKRSSSGASPGNQLRAYRNAALSTGSAGAWTHVSFDALSSLESASGFTLSSGRIVAPVDGHVTVSGRIAYTGKLLLVQMKIRVIVEPVGGGADIVYDEIPWAALTSGADAIPFAYDPLLALGDKIRIDAASIGVGTATIGTGDLNTWIKVSA